MKIVWFVHAIASCWNNGNAHFLRGIGSDLQRRGHDVLYCEPAGGWSETNLLRDEGPAALNGFSTAYPELRHIKYDAAQTDLSLLTDGADLVIVHEWNEPALVNRLAAMRRNGAGFVLLFHDTHHRALTQSDAMRRFELDGYDGVLAFGRVLAELYESAGWGKRVWTWHEAADTSRFYPRENGARDSDLVWVGNWGDDERSAELHEFLITPAAQLRLRANIFGVRYPAAAIGTLAARGFAFRGWLPNHAVPEIFARHHFTVHVPRRPYAETLRGIPTIRVFEALACGIPLVSAPWSDSENLFPERCFLMARNGAEMRSHMRALACDDGLAGELRDNGLKVVRERHSCRHRVGELLDIYGAIRGDNNLSARKPEAA